MKYINYNNCIVGIPNSILSYFGLEKCNQSNVLVDEYLRKYNPKNIVLIICDGMGNDFLNEYLPDNNFLRKNIKSVISSVFPTTTTSAITSLITGLYPNEHCWLGFDNYISELDKVVSMFLNKEKDTDYIFSIPNICRIIFPYKTIIEKINESGIANATYISKNAIDANERYSSFDEICTIIKDICDNNKKNYVFAHYENPDYLMHKYGIDSSEVIQNVEYISRKIEEMFFCLNDTLLIISADHGLFDNDYIYIEDDTDFFECLLHTTSIASRASMFFLKHGYEDKFLEYFNKKYKNFFLLLSKKEILEKKLFGIGTDNEKFESCLGDYIAISISNYSFKYIRKGSKTLASHSGLTENEVDVPLVMVYKK